MEGVPGVYKITTVQMLLAPIKAIHSALVENVYSAPDVPEHFWPIVIKGAGSAEASSVQPKTIPELVISVAKS